MGHYPNLGGSIVHSPDIPLLYKRTCCGAERFLILSFFHTPTPISTLSLIQSLTAAPDDDDASFYLTQDDRCCASINRLTLFTDRPTSSCKSTAPATIYLTSTRRPTTRTPASRPLTTSTHGFDSTSRPDDTLSRKPTAHDLDSRLRFHKPTRRHVIPQADRLCAPPLIRGRPTSTFYSTSRPMKLYSRKTTDSQHRKSTDDI
ncbi:hypothetical protein CPB85DRAFT_1430755 [Mucidula mucida]|nr:hypothetical protein CPB85DRAFT_1430755 [Mucidula mucida]